MIVPVKLTREQFHTQYQPSASGEWSESQLAKWHQQRRLWTVLECDGQTIIANGFHRVNRVAYIVCKVPYVGEVDVHVDD